MEKVENEKKKAEMDEKIRLGCEAALKKMPSASMGDDSDDDELAGPDDIADFAAQIRAAMTGGGRRGPALDILDKQDDVNLKAEANKLKIRGARDGKVVDKDAEGDGDESEGEGESEDSLKDKLQSPAAPTVEKSNANEKNKNTLALNIRPGESISGFNKRLER